MENGGNTEKLKSTNRLRPSLTPEADENQLISLAIDAAKKMLLDGNAPTSVVLHYLKLATSRERLEREIMETKRELMEAQKKSLESQAKIESLYTEALKAMQRYSGNSEEDLSAPI